MINKKNKIVICLGLFVYMLLVSSFASLFASNYSNFDNNIDLETSSVNTLYNGKSYPFEIRDVYDDENNTKIYTAAYLQTEYNLNGTVFEDEVSVVNNTNYKSPSNTGITMINGTFDDADNMRANDDTYSNFTSAGGGESSIYVDPDGDGTVQWSTSGSDLHWENVDDGIREPDDPGTADENRVGLGDNNKIDEYTFETATVGSISQVVLWHYGRASTGEDAFNSIYIGGAWQSNVLCGFTSTSSWKSRTFNGDWDQDDLDDLQVRYTADSAYGEYDYTYLYASYCKIIYSEPTELNFTVDLNFNEVDTSKLLALDVSSHHYTNISTTITGNIYNYTSSSYTQMFSSDNIAETENDFMNDTSPSDYLNASCNLRLYFTGTNSISDFKLSIDYIMVRFYYKMDIIIYKTFYINGIWQYRFKLVGSLHYTDWTVFEVIDPEPNFYAISESDLTTRWILQNATILAVEDFHDDINTDYWNLYDVSEDSFYASSSGSYLLDNSTETNIWDYTGTNFYVGGQVSLPVGITWDGTNFWVIGITNKRAYKYTSAGVYVSSNTLHANNDHPRGVCWDGNHFYVGDYIDNLIYEYTDAWVFVTTHILNVGNTVPSGVTWDGTNFFVIDLTAFGVKEVYKYTSAWVFVVKYDLAVANSGSFGVCWNGTYFYVGDVLGNKVYKYNTTWALQDSYNVIPLVAGLDWDGTYFRVLGSDKKVYNYEYLLNVSKNYFGSGYMYMQTNETETVSLRSIDYTTHYNLSSGDYFEVDFQTSSDSKINLVLLKDEGDNQTLTLSQSGNANFDRHTAKISVDEFIEFDQLKINSTFEDGDYLKVHDIKTYKYTLTGDSADFYVGSKRNYEVYLTPDEYNLRIFEGITEMVDVNITIPETGVKQYIYTPIERIECRLTLFSLAEEYLQFEDYHVNVSRSLGGVYGDFWLVDTLFYVDDGTNIYIDVYDRFDALIYSDFELAKPYIDLYIEVYSLKIRNEATEIVDYILQNTDTGSYKSGTLFSDEIIEYHVKSGSYSLDYTNYEDMYPRECNFELETHKTISINSTYHTVYIGLFTYDGLGINRDWVRLYINGLRADFGFNVIDSETMELIVLDYFNNTLANETIDTSAYSEYNLYAQVYSLYLLNRFTYDDLIMNITQVDSGMWMNQLIPASSALLYRFIPNINYTINVTYINGTVYNIRTINLTLNSQTESFGISTQLTEYPKNVYFGVYTTTGLGIDHDLLRFYIDGNRTDFGFNRIEDMIVTLVVRDYFNTTLFNQNVNTSGIYEYNILITLYSLQIKNLQLQETTVDVNATLYEGTLLSEESLYFMLAEDYYEIGYYDTNNIYNQFTIYLDSNQAYELNRSQICFLIYADQQGNHLVFENYKTYLNGSRAYINNFYREIGDIVGIEIMDRYNISIKNDTLTVVSGINEKYVVLTMYSLKVMSQQLVFNHVNITRDSDYYESDMYWSEWIAPGEIIDFRLFAGYYTINVTNVEDSSFSLYDYTLNGDDVILISSENTLYNVLYNIANVNTTIGNQITNVEINITNQNSAINNTVINIEINLDNINSSLGTMLVDIDTAISNINTSIINEIVSMGTIINNINTSIINQILDIGVNITNMNTTLVSQLLTLGVSIENINGSIIDQIITLGVDVSNFNTSLSNQILSIEVDISNLDTSITNQFSYVISNITNVNTTISTQISSLSSDIINVNSTIVNQIIDLGVDITNINTSIIDQILSIEVDITNLDTSIINQISYVISNITNVNTTIYDQTLIMLADISNTNSTLLSQMVELGVDITNINVSITNQILDLSVDLTNINASISNLLYYMDIDITSIGNNITSFYASVNTSFINLDTFINNSFIWLESNIFAFNTSISNLVIGVDNSIYLINGTISTMITNLENNLLLMNVSINTSLFNLNTTINLIGSNITSNYILLNNTLNLIDTNINDTRIAMINNLLLVNNTISVLIADVYSAVYLINNSIYTAVVDLGTYLSLMNNTIDGNLSFILQQNEFLSEIYKMTMFSELLNWTDIGLNTSLLTSQIDMWTLINNYKNQSIEVHLRYQDIIEKLTISADDLLRLYLPATGVEYRLWSVELEEYIDGWEEMPDDMVINFGFYETTVPVVPEPLSADFITAMIFMGIVAVLLSVATFAYANIKRDRNEIPEERREKIKRQQKEPWKAGTFKDEGYG